MSLDRAIAAGKERRRPFKGSARFDRSCRHGGSCDYCSGNRQIAGRRAEAAALADLRAETGCDQIVIGKEP